MIVFPFGFLGVSAEIPGVTYLYNQWVRSLGHSLYYDYDVASGRGYDRTVNWNTIITHGWSANGSPVDDTGYSTKSSSQYHRTNRVQALGPTVSVGGWANWLSTPGGTRPFFYFSAGSSANFELRWASPQILYVRSGGVTRTIDFSSVVSTSTWHHYFFAIGNGEMRLWVDGKYVGQATGLGTFSPTATQLVWTTGTEAATGNFDSWGVWASSMGEPGRVVGNRPYWLINDKTDYELDVCASSPIVHYRLGETSGLPVNLVNPGTYDVSAVVGAITQGVTPGLIHPDYDDGCVSANNGNNHYYVIPTLPVAGDDEDVGMAVFAEFDAANAFKVIGSFDAQNPQWEFFQDGTAVTLRGGIRTDTGYNGTFTTPACFDETARYQYGFWCDGPGSPQEIVINAVVIHSNTTTGTMWAVSGTGNNHILNSVAPTGGIAFGGKMDEFSYWYGQGLTLMDFAMHNARARKFNDYEFYIAKQLPQFHCRMMSDALYNTDNLECEIGPNYITRYYTGSLPFDRTPPPMSVDGVLGTPDFAGGSDELRITNSVDLDSKINGTNYFTLNIWGYSENFSTGIPGSFRELVSNGNSYRLYFDSNGSAIEFDVVGITNVVGPIPKTRRWVMYTCTYDAVAGEATMYHDGVQVAQNTGLSGTMANPSGVTTKIGTNSSFNYDWDGSLAQLTIDNTTWTPQQIKMAYYLGRGMNKANAAHMSHDPVCYWPMDELAGDVIRAYGSALQHGTLVGTPTVNSDSPFVDITDPSVDFGATDYANGTHDFGLSGATSLTFSAWLRRGDGTVGTYGHVFNKNHATAGYASIRVAVESDNRLRFGIEDGSRYPRWHVDYPPVYTDLSGNSYNDPWYHVVIVWDRVGATGASTDVTMYINGRNMRTNGEVSFTDGAPAYVGNAYTFSESSQEWRINDLAPGGGSTTGTFEGNIAKVMLTEKALNDAEVKELYLAGLEQDIVPKNLPVAPITVSGSFTDDFESNDFSAWTYASSGAQVTTTSTGALSGTYSMQIVNGGSADTNPSNPDPNNNHVLHKDLGADQLLKMVRCKFKITALGSDDASFLHFFDNANGYNNPAFALTWARATVSDAGRSIWLSDGTFTDTNIALTVGTEYIATIYDIDWGAGLWSLRVEEAVTGILVKEWYGLGFDTAHTSGIRNVLISQQLGPDTTTTVLYDDIEIIY